MSVTLTKRLIKHQDRKFKKLVGRERRRFVDPLFFKLNEHGEVVPLKGEEMIREVQKIAEELKVDFDKLRWILRSSDSA